MKNINILITEDHQLVRECWIELLNREKEFTVVGDTGSGEEAIQMARELRPDIVLMDINLPGINGIEATSLIRKSSPGSKIIAVSLHSQPAYARKMMKAGAMGYVSKNSSQQEMIMAIHEVMDNKKYICTELQNLMNEQQLHPYHEKTGAPSLTSRELDIIKYVIKGLSSKEIADEEGISFKTVEVHRYSILKKLKVRNVAELINYVTTNEILMEKN